MQNYKSTVQTLRPEPRTLELYISRDSLNDSMRFRASAALIRRRRAAEMDKARQMSFKVSGDWL